MKHFLVIKDNEVIHRYEAEEQLVLSGPNGYGHQIECPEGINYLFAVFNHDEEGPALASTFQTEDDGTVTETVVVRGTITLNEELKALSETSQRTSDLIEQGQITRMRCDKALSLITGYNQDRELTSEQITSMQTTFAPILSALMVGRPNSAAALVEAVEPDGVLVTEQMKADILSVLSPS